MAESPAPTYGSVTDILHDTLLDRGANAFGALEAVLKKLIKDENVGSDLRITSINIPDDHDEFTNVQIAARYSVRRLRTYHALGQELEHYLNAKSISDHFDDTVAPIYSTPTKITDDGALRWDSTPKPSVEITYKVNKMIIDVKLQLIGPD